MNDLTCVVVTYNPNLEYFRVVLSKIYSNDVSIIVVDNGSENSHEIQKLVSSVDVSFISLGENVGIAKAQNLGVEKAFSEGANYVWLSDQDTVYPDTYAQSVSVLVEDLKEKKIRYGAIGPSFFELNRQRIEPFVKFDPYGKRFQPREGLNPVAHLIASGMIIPKNAFYAVGAKREDFFIDWVDLEWCWRANAKGYPVFGVGDLVIEHNLGDDMVKVANKQISIRSPFRHYFIIRNGLYLCLHDKLLPFWARMHYLALTLATSLGYPILARTQKWQHLKVNMQALWHGLIGRLGPKP